MRIRVVRMRGYDGSVEREGRYTGGVGVRSGVTWYPATRHSSSTGVRTRSSSNGPSACMARARRITNGPVLCRRVSRDWTVVNVRADGVPIESTSCAARCCHSRRSTPSRKRAAASSQLSSNSRSAIRPSHSRAAVRTARSVDADTEPDWANTGGPSAALSPARRTKIVVSRRVMTELLLETERDRVRRGRLSRPRLGRATRD